MDETQKARILHILDYVEYHGLKWKTGKDISHLKTRIGYGHLPANTKLEEYEQLILNLLTNRENDVYLYFVKGYKQDYFVFGDGIWIAIIGEDMIMETAFRLTIPYHDYLTELMGYTFLGKLKEVYI